MSTLSNEFHFIEVWWNLSKHLIELHFFPTLIATILKFNLLDFHFANVQCPPYLIGLYWGLSSTLLRLGGAYLAASQLINYALYGRRATLQSIRQKSYEEKKIIKKGSH